MNCLASSGIGSEQIRCEGTNLSDVQFEKYLLKITKDSDITFTTEKDKTQTIRKKNNAQSLQLQNLNILGTALVHITPHRNQKHN